MKTLADLNVTDQATVAEIDGQDEIALRLLEMGLTPGTQVTLIGTAPLGDPLEFEIRGYRLSLRKTEATRVTID
ncbi:MAG: ferrous iron transport protein A, partial [Planctomycetaceae bacterium]|nr:ferrous iron transport protein A [Planctomycetaceae bacterium]